MKPYILVAEDEPEIAMMIKYNLEKGGFEVNIAEDGDEAALSVEERHPDLIVLDWMLPMRTGVEVCQSLRRDDDTSAIPIIMLTARSEEADKLMGLDSGADDYMVKPFSPKELVARIRAVLRRSRPVFSKKTIEYAGLRMDVEGRKVFYKEKTVQTGPTEFGLLMHMLEKPGQVFTREKLLDKIWGHDIYVENRTVDVHILRLRRALSDAHEGLGNFIQTVRSVGYKLEIPADMQEEFGMPKEGEGK